MRRQESCHKCLESWGVPHKTHTKHRLVKVPEAGVNRDLMDLIPIPAILPSYEGQGEVSQENQETTNLNCSRSTGQVFIGGSNVGESPLKLSLLNI